MKILLLLPLLLGFSVPAIAHNENNGGLPLSGPGGPAPCAAGLTETMGGRCEKSCGLTRPKFNSSTGQYTDYKGRKCGSITCITVRNGDNWKGVWSCSGRPE
jgi:hypothetical protein